MPLSPSKRLAIIIPDRCRYGYKGFPKVDAFLNMTIQNMLKSRKWGPPLQALFSWQLQASEGDEETETETEIDVLTEALPDASEHLREKSADWLALFRRLEKATCGDLILGRRGFKTRFRWRDPPFHDLARTALAFVGGIIPTSGIATASVVPQNRDSETVHPFPLRHNLTVYIRVPANVTRDELSRLADFIRLLPTSYGEI
jgi:hypothetical protein